MTHLRKRQMRATRWFSGVLGFGLSGIFLGLAAYKVDLGQVRLTLSNISSTWLIPMVAISLIDFWVRAVRWVRAFPRSARPKTRHAFSALMIGTLANNFVPGRLGDVARAGLIGQVLPQFGTSGALATVVLEKVLDGIMLVALLGLALLVAPLPFWVARVGVFGAVLFLGTLSVLFALNVRGSRPRIAKTIKARRVGILRLKTDVCGLLDRFVSGLNSLKNRKQFTVLLTLTLVIWLLEILIMYLTFRAVGLVLPVVAAMVGVVLLALGLMIPAAPGYVGTYQFFVITALQLYSVSEPQALAMGLFLNIFVFALTTVVGLLALASSGLTWPSRTNGNCPTETTGV